jgi:hypothetical protein
VVFCCKDHGLLCAKKTDVLIGCQGEVEEAAEPARELRHVGSGLTGCELDDLVEDHQYFCLECQRRYIG